MAPDLLQFRPEDHTYWLRGQRLISVTQVLEETGVVDYSSVPPRTRNMALKRGSAVHLMTQLDDEGDLDEETLSDELRPYLEAWRRWRATTGFVIDAAEERVHHAGYRYAGTLDRRGRIGKRRVVVDIKTNNAEAWVKLQIAAYLGTFPEPRIYERVCVELHANGEPKDFYFPINEWQKDFTDFLYLLTANRIRSNYQGKAA